MMNQQFEIQNYIGAPITKTRLSEQAIIAIPPNLSKFTQAEKKLQFTKLFRDIEDQQQLADRVIAESNRIQHETKERCDILKATSEQRLQERVGDVGFNQNELILQRKEIYIELEALGMYKRRIEDFLASLLTNSIEICRKCLILRDGRVGIDLAEDPVEQALQREITTILGANSLIKRTLEQLNEQMRRLRSTRYLLDRDLQYKQGAMDLDTGSLSLKSSDSCLAIYEGYAKLDPANISSEEYNNISKNNIIAAGKEITSSRPIKTYIDTLMQQIFDDLNMSYEITNHEFNERIKETEETLDSLYMTHKKTTRRVIAMQDNITELKSALASKERHMALAHTRLGRRAQRVGAELVIDAAAQALNYECEMLRHSTEQLQQMLHEATSSLRYLLQIQIRQEEEINVKLNTLKIDKVDCMTLRKGMIYHKY